MTALAIIGWLVIVGVGLYCLAAGAITAFLSLSFGGDHAWIPLALLLFGGSVVALGWWIAPISIHVNGAS
jgi:hypothetical protein